MIDLYKDLIIDHGINPRNKYIMNNYTTSTKGINHFCGDTFDLFLFIENNILSNISFYGKGCTISTASASLLSIHLKLKSLKEAEKITKDFNNIFKNNNINNPHYINDLNILSCIKNYPSRVKCGTLIWHTFLEGIKNLGDTYVKY
jgi:nitrogen fixation protein NifU and related proteins